MARSRRAEAVIVWLSPTLATFKAGNWRITSGTGAYRHLHTGGTPAVTPDSFADLSTGVVDMEHVGRAHWSRTEAGRRGVGV